MHLAKKALKKGPPPGELISTSPDTESNTVSDSSDSDSNQSDPATNGNVAPPSTSEDTSNESEQSNTTRSTNPLLISPFVAPVLSATPQADQTGKFTLGDFTLWGVDGDTISASDFVYDTDTQTITVNTNKHFAIQNTDQTKIADGDSKGYLQNASAIGFIIPAGVSVHMQLENIYVRNGAPIDIKPSASLTLILGDRTKNKIDSNNTNHAAIHCPTGANLLVDDSVRNITSDGTHITPENGVVPYDCTLQNGKKISKGQPLSVLDSMNPGELYALGSAYPSAAIIGSNVNGAYYAYGASQLSQGEAGGNMTFDGGLITAMSDNFRTAEINAPWYNSGSAIGGGECGNGTGLNEWITINSGRVIAYGAYHGSGIGAGLGATSGNIRINGGYVESWGGGHGNGFGGGCTPQDSSQYQIILTGGTLLPTTRDDNIDAIDFFNDAGAPGLQVQMTGGSLGNSKGAAGFKFDGTAINDKDEPIEMVEIDLTADVGTNAYKITNWNLLVDGKPYPYGAPAEFDKGHLYLWLPKTIKDNSEITVDLSYLNTDELDKNGNPTEVTPLPLYRQPGASQDGKLRRYADFKLPKEYEDSLIKPYDGLPFKTFAISPDKPLRTEEKIGSDASGNPVYRYLTNADAVTYKYQLYDKKEGTPLDVEINRESASNVGVMKFVATSTEYSNTDGFKESYWGHRATGWCEITKVASKVSAVTAKWDDGTSADNAQTADQRLNVSVDITSGDGTAVTCKAPTGKVQFYIDGEAAGNPIELKFDGDGANTTVTKDADGREHSVLTHSFIASDVDYLLPNATTDGKHVISAQYLPAINYFESASPTEDKNVPSTEVTIKPVDPEPGVEPENPPTGTEVDTGTPEPDPETGGQVIRSHVDLIYPEGVTPGAPNPGRLVLKLDSLSHGPVTLTNADGVVVDAVLTKDANGNPVKDENGKYTLTLDPLAVGTSTVTVKQAANGAYIATTWIIDVAVHPNPKITPNPSVTKSVKNLTHPEGPTQVGDKLLYTLSATNTAVGSAWDGVAITDPFPTCLIIDKTSVHVTNASEHFDGSATEIKPEDILSLGRFSISPSADGKDILSVGLGSVYSGRVASATFECTVKEGSVGADLANTASATGTRPDPDNPDNPLPVTPPDTPPVTPPGTGKVAPSDPDADDVDITKNVTNLTRSDKEHSRVGDKLAYSIKLTHSGDVQSCLMNAAIVDPLPTGIEYIPGTLKLISSDGTSKAVTDSAYNKDARTISVTVGDMWENTSYALSFECEITYNAHGNDLTNIAYEHGTVPSSDPKADPTNPTPGEPGDIPDPDDPSFIASDPTSPNELLPEDPDPKADVKVVKSATNLSRDDGTTHVGDTIHYTLSATNSKEHTAYMDLVFKDEVPVGLEPIHNTISLTLADGTKLSLDDAVYDPRTRILSVYAGNLHGGQTITVGFDCLIMEEARTSDIGNIASIFGEMPSTYDFDKKHPDIGESFIPPQNDWESFAKTHNQIDSNLCYPPGVTSEGGVLEGDANLDDTIRAHNLVKTGDVLIPSFIGLIALTIIAGICTHRLKRRLRKQS